MKPSYMLTLVKAIKTSNKTKYEVFTWARVIQPIHRKLLLSYFARLMSKHPITVVSENSDHSRIAVLACVDMVVKEMEKQIDLKRLIIWSDACAS